MTDIDALIVEARDRLQSAEDYVKRLDHGEFDNGVMAAIRAENAGFFRAVVTALSALTAERAKLASLQAAALDLLEALTTERAKVAELEAEVKIAEAKGWRDAVTCVQYCAANWHQDGRSEAERKSLEAATCELVNELVTASPGEWLGTEWKTAQDYNDTIAKLEAEVERLNKALTYEQHRAGRQGTHWPGCHIGGPEHYECALRELEAATDDQ
jgi:hypothetical protein